MFQSTSWKKSFNSQNTRPNLIPSKIVPIGWVDLNSKTKFAICHWSWELGSMWHFFRKFGDKILTVSFRTAVFWRGPCYFAEDQNNSHELPDVNAHKVSWFSFKMPNSTYLPRPMTNLKFYFWIQMYASNRFNFW